MDHCCKIIGDPNLLISPSASYATGTLDSKIWDNPEAIYAVLHYAPNLPHLQGVLIAFFNGALETWVQFSSEFAPDGDITQATNSEQHRAFMLPTNDDNEGMLGGRRQALIRAPNMSQRSHNSQVCQIRIEISDYTGDKISVGVARPSRIGQSVPCDG